MAYIDYYPLGCLENYFVDKTTGLPLAGGKIYVYRNYDKSTLKKIYKIIGDPESPSFTELSNPLILSAVGTIVDENGQNIVPYIYPYDIFGGVQLAYIRVCNANDVLQFERSFVPARLDPSPALESAIDEMLKKV